MRESRLYNPKRGIDVRLHSGVEVLGRNVQDRGARLLPSGVVDNDVQAAQSFDGVLDQPLAESFVAKITRNRETDAFLGFDQRDDFLRIRFLGREIVDG